MHAGIRRAYASITVKPNIGSAAAKSSLIYTMKDEMNLQVLIYVIEVNLSISK